MKFVCKKCGDSGEKPCYADIPVGCDETKKDVEMRMIVCPLIGVTKESKRWVPNGDVNVEAEWKRVE